jgi:hypothetical protein
MEMMPCFMAYWTITNRNPISRGTIRKKQEEVTYKKWALRAFIMLKFLKAERVLNKKLI